MTEIPEGYGFHLDLVVIDEAPMVALRIVNGTEDVTVTMHPMDAGRLAVALRDLVVAFIVEAS